VVKPDDQKRTVDVTLTFKGAPPKPEKPRPQHSDAPTTPGFAHLSAPAIVKSLCRSHL